MNQQLFDLSGKVAVVTGARTGLGQAIAVGLAQAGADIIAVGSTQFEETKTKVEGAGRRFHSIQADLTNSKNIPSVVEEMTSTFGKMDILVNNAGIILRDDAVDYSEEYWDKVMNINVKAAFMLSQGAIRQYQKQGTGGKIINIASLLSFQGGIRVPAYTASKFGIAGITMALSNEVAKDNINVNAIAPGYMITDNTEALRNDPDRYQAILDRIPAGRWGDSEDLVGTAVFLSSKASDYVTGQIIAVDGGWLAR